MKSNTARQPFHCPQCGAGLSLRPDQHPDMKTAERTLKGWMAGNETVKDLDRKAEIVKHALLYLPLWYFKVRAGAEEEVYIEPAAATARSLLRKLALPPGEMRFYNPQAVPNVVSPSVPYQAALEWLSNQGLSVEHVREAALVHVPLYFFRYRYRQKTYIAAVDGSYGQVLSDLYPTRWEVPYQTIAVVAFAVFFLEAFIAYLVLPWVGGKLLPAYALRCVIQLITAVPLFIVAWLIARKA